MRRVGKREMEVLFSPDEAAYGGRWPVARKYRVDDGVIYPCNDLNDIPSRKTFGMVPLDMPMSTPLADGDAFLSFAHLADGHIPPEDTEILDWVHGHGLLRLLEPSLSPKDTVRMKVEGVEWNELNQEPMSLEEFREETLYAYELLNLYEAIRSGDSAALRDRIDYAHRSQGRTPITEMFIGVERIWYFIPGGKPTSDDDVLDWCRLTLHLRLQNEIKGFTPVFTPDGNIAVRCPDLRTALYWQFACLVQGKRAIVTCRGCKNPLVQRRPNHWYHNSTCRSRKSRKRNT